MPSANLSPADVAEPAAGPVAEPAIEPWRPRAVPPAPTAGTPCAISPGRCARWARAEGFEAGDTVALLMGEPSEIAALRLGLARIGVRAGLLDAAGDLAGCRAAIVDTGLAEAYAGMLAQVQARPTVWWNGAGADFARLDLALAEYDDAPLSAAEILRR